MKRPTLAVLLLAGAAFSWSETTATPDDATIAHVVGRLTWGARSADLATARALGLSA